MKRLFVLLLVLCTFACGCNSGDNKPTLHGTWEGADGYYMYFNTETGTGAQINRIKGTDSSFTYELTDLGDFFEIEITTEGGNKLVMKLVWNSDKEISLDWYGQIQEYKYLQKSKISF